MNCPACNHPSTSVVDSTSKDETVIRRRKCDKCGVRWNTMEVLDQPGIESARKLLEQLKTEMHTMIDGLTI